MNDQFDLGLEEAEPIDEFQAELEAEGTEDAEPEVEVEPELLDAPDVPKAEEPSTYIVDGIIGQTLDFYAEGKRIFTVPCGIPVALTDEQVVYLKQCNKI